MKRILLALGTALLLGATTALALPAPPGSASAAPSAAASALPPGHPPVGEGMPAGHPSVGADEDEEEQGTASDSAVDDPTLPPGTILVTVKDADDKPVAHAPVSLGVLHSTVARGDSTEQRGATTDEAGSARFEGLSTGSGYSYRASTSRGPAQYAYPPFGLGARAGKRVVLHSFDASGKLDTNVVVVMRSAVVVSLREDAIQFQQLISVMNMGKVAWLADMPVYLPSGFKAFNKQDAADDARIEEVPGTGAAIRGTFPPGQRNLEFAYQVPLEGDATQSLSLRLPARTTQTRVIAEASKTMGLEVKGFPQAKHADGRDGKHLLVTDLAAHTPGEASSIEITLTGLPTQGPGRWIAVAIALVAVGLGIVQLTQSKSGAADEDTQRDLAEAREALLGELVALERARKSGEIGPKTYGRVRASLLDALARIVAMIEAGDPKKKDPRRPGPKPARRAEASP